MVILSPAVVSPQEHHSFHSLLSSREHRGSGEAEHHKQQRLYLRIHLDILRCLHNDLLKTVSQKKNLCSSLRITISERQPRTVTVMHLEVKVALNFIVSYLYNKLPRRRADLFGEELERILVSRFEGHWYPEAPLRGSAFRCIHLGAPRDPVVELAAKRSGLDTEEVHANVPAELSVWIDPYEVSYQIGEKGAVKVLYLEDPPGLGCEGEDLEDVQRDVKGEVEAEENKSVVFNPDAQVFVPISSQASPTLLPSLSPPPLPTSCHGLFSYPSSNTPPELAPHSSNTSSPSPPSVMPYLSSQQPARPQPITFTTASFAATKFGSTKMKKSSGVMPAAVPPVPRMLSRSPPVSASELLKHKPLSLSLHSLGGPIPSQLSPNAKEFMYPGSPGQLYFETDTQPMQAHTSPFQPPHTVSNQPTFDPFSSPPPAPSVGIIGSGGGPMSYVEKPPFVDGLGNYNLQYQSPSFQPVVLAN